MGTTSRIPGNMGKLAKLMKVPVVTLSVHGSYLAGPFWDEEHIGRSAHGGQAYLYLHGTGAGEGRG